MSLWPTTQQNDAIYFHASFLTVSLKHIENGSLAAYVNVSERKKKAKQSGKEEGSCAFVSLCVCGRVSTWPWQRWEVGAVAASSSWLVVTVAKALRLLNRARSRRSNYSNCWPFITPVAGRSWWMFECLAKWKRSDSASSSPHLSRPHKSDGHHGTKRRRHDFRGHFSYNYIFPSLNFFSLFLFFHPFSVLYYLSLSLPLIFFLSLSLYLFFRVQSYSVLSIIIFMAMSLSVCRDLSALLSCDWLLLVSSLCGYSLPAVRIGMVNGPPVTPDSVFCF